MESITLFLAEHLTLANAYIALLWGIRLAALILVPFRRSPSAAKAWLLLIFFQPLIGLGLYLVFGRAIQPRWLQQRRKRWEQMFRTIITKINSISDRRGYTLKHTPPLHATYIQKQFPLPPADGNHAQWIDNYESFNKQLIADITNAKHHVHLLFYIYRNDAVGRKVANALADASARGVTCRVLIDAIGSWPRTIRRRLLKSGVHVHSAVPLNRRTTNIFNITRADLRNHRKIAIIDGLIGYTGSQNLTKPNTPHQQELMIRLTGPATLGLQAIFSADWFLESEEVLDQTTYYPAPPTKPKGDAIAQVLPSGPDYPGTSVDDLVITLTHNARTRVMVATPYFIPSDPLLHAMRSAVKRGVEVHLLTSAYTDSHLVKMAQQSYYTELLKAGIHVHEYTKGFFHAKYLTIDNLATMVGSSNIDLRSFELNGEINIILHSNTLTEDLTTREKEWLKHSHTLELKSWHSRPLPYKIAENMARLLSPLL